jgi:hypothetical protein
VPQQALFLMNSPFAVEQARAIAVRTEAAGVAAPPARIDSLYRLLYGRSPTGEEIELGMRFVSDASRERPDVKLTPWEQYAQVLMLANEFAFMD